MTHKQIIIDGIDVNALRSDEIACMNRYEVARLFNKTIELLVAKEQECEELKDKIRFMEEYIKTVENARNELEQQLETENKQLKVNLIEAKAHSDYLNNLALSETLNHVSEQLDKYKQTLTEIQKIMKKHCKKCKKHKFYHFKLCCTCKYTDILQKIGECEVEDDRQTDNN